MDADFGSRIDGPHRTSTGRRGPCGVGEGRFAGRGKWYSCADTGLVWLPAPASGPGPLVSTFRLLRHHAERVNEVTLALLWVKSEWRCLRKSHAERR